MSVAVRNVTGRLATDRCNFFKGVRKMSTIISKVRLFVPLDLTTIPEHMSNDWRDSLKSKAESIDKKRKLIISY